MRTYSFIAECDHDTNDLPEIFRRHGIHATMVLINRIIDSKPPRIVPGWMVELKTDAEKPAILAVFAEVPDSHMMQDSLEEQPFFKDKESKDRYYAMNAQLIKERDSTRQ